MERDGGIEPPTLDWKSKVMPFYESRNSVPMLIQAGALLGTTQRQDLKRACTLTTLFTL